MLIFFDLDGTLITEDTHFMPDSAREAIAAARRNGHICAVNTGRTKKLVGPDVARLAEFDAFLMGCGTMITCGERVLFHRTFDEKESLEILETLRDLRIDAVLEGSGNNYRDSFENMYYPVFKEFARSFTDAGYGNFSEAVGNFDKLYAYADDVSAMRAFQERFGGRLDFVDMEKGFFEIMPAGCSKASAMKVLADMLGVPMSQTAALGDSGNDVSMLERAAYGIAMGNAPESVRRAADHVTARPEEDGVWKALEWLGVL